MAYCAKSGISILTALSVNFVKQNIFRKRKIVQCSIGFSIFIIKEKNRLGKKVNLDIGENVFAPGLFIAHTNIIVGSAKVGNNCKLHGQNCIGSGAVIGNNCELWVGAKVFGPSRLANNITVAAGAVVISSFDEEGITVGGVPARKIK